MQALCDTIVTVGTDRLRTGAPGVMGGAMQPAPEGNWAMGVATTSDLGGGHWTTALLHYSGQFDALPSEKGNRELAGEVTRLERLFEEGQRRQGGHGRRNEANVCGKRPRRRRTRCPGRPAARRCGSERARGPRARSRARRPR